MASKLATKFTTRTSRLSIGVRHGSPTNAGAKWRNGRTRAASPILDVGIALRKIAMEHRDAVGAAPSEASCTNENAVCRCDSRRW